MRLTDCDSFGLREAEASDCLGPLSTACTKARMVRKGHQGSLSVGADLGIGPDAETVSAPR